MARLSISNAARVTGVSRVMLHRYIKARKLSRTPDGSIDTYELLRVGLTLHLDTVTDPVTVQRPVTPGNILPVTSDTTALERLIDALQQQLTDARAREQVAHEREALLLQMLQQVQQQNQRLLEAPRSTAPPAPAPAAVRTTDTSLSALDQRLAVRRGKTRAIIAVAHSMVRSVLHMLSYNAEYREWGGNYVDERRRQFTVDRLTRRIEHVGYQVHLEPVATPAA